MKLKTVLLNGLAMLTVAAVAIGGTVAYLTSEDKKVNVMTLGNVEIEQVEYERVVDANGNWVIGTHTGYGYTADEMQPFTDNKTAYPAVYRDGTVKWDDRNGNQNASGDGSHQQPWSQIDAPGSNQLFDDSVKNVIDKFVFVKNTGASDCYYRTYIAIEWPETLDTKLLHTNMNTNARFTQTDLGFIKDEENGVNYLVYEMLYNEVLTPGETSRPSLLQLFLDPATTNEDVALFGEKWEVIAISQAIQTAGFEGSDQALSRAAINAADLALDTGFGEPMAIHEEANIENVTVWFFEAYEEYEAAQSDTWDGTADTTWYNDTDTAFEITSAEQFAGLGELVDEGNTFEGKTLTLSRDLDLYLEDENGEKVSFNPIGYGYNTVFKGTFDAQDHVISNLYQNGWALGYDYSTEAGGLFASVVDASIKNLKIDNAEIVMECIDMGIVVGYSYGNCTYENIEVTNSSISNYNRYTGGIVGEVNGTQTFKNVDIDETCTVSTLWGSFDTSVGGIVGGKYGDASLTFEDCDVACVIDSYNDVTATPARQWYAYRRAGMLIGNTEESVNVDGRNEASASYLTATNCTVTYGNWANYTYCEFNHMSTSWPHCRVQAGSSPAYTNGRYGTAKDAEGNLITDDNHTHADGEDHNLSLPFDQLFGGDVGVYGGAAHNGVTVVYNNR